MEKYNYPSIQAVLDESAELVRLMECAQWGYAMDQQEELADMKAEQEAEMRK